MSVDAVLRGGGDEEGGGDVTEALLDYREMKALDCLRNQALIIREAKKLLPHTAGVYFVFDGDEIRYVGISHDLRNRWASHSRQRQFYNFENPRLSWHQMSFSESVVAERRWIACLAGLVNGQRHEGSVPTMRELGGRRSPPSSLDSLFAEVFDRFFPSGDRGL